MHNQDIFELGEFDQLAARVYPEYPPLYAQELTLKLLTQAETTERDALLRKKHKGLADLWDQYQTLKKILES